MSEEFGTGYCPDDEDVAHIEATQRTLETETLFSASYDGPINESVREAGTEACPIEDQMRTNSCTGHGGSGVEEFNEWLETQRWTQRSRWGAYILGQEAAGRPHVDNGCTIDGIARMGSETGWGREQLWKFTGQYHVNPPGGRAAYLADAALRKTKSWKRLSSFADMALWSQTGQGGIMVGWPWFSNWYNIPADGIVPDPNNELVGFHCVALYWQINRAEGSRYCFEGPNSYRRTWGRRGFGIWRPSLIDWLMKYRGSFVVGFSGMRQEEAVARPLNYLKSSSFLK